MKSCSANASSLDFSSISETGATAGGNDPYALTLLAFALVLLIPGGGGRGLLAELALALAVDREGSARRVSGCCRYDR
jgi:hypothetical protein